MDLQVSSAKLISGKQLLDLLVFLSSTVKTLYNVTHYNRIFNKVINMLGTDLFPLKFPLYNRIFT